jgi:hypothetical protein
MDHFLELHSGEVTILVLAVMVLGTLLAVVPQLLRVHRYSREMLHAERMRALEQGMQPPHSDDLSVLAGRTAFLVPIVVVCVAGTVTCFLIAYRSESVFAVALVVWVVSGVASLAAITGGVALMGRLGQLGSGVQEEAPPANPLEG